ncbi:hypothetical protein TDSAC_0397 [Thermodesulfobium acidiphilum]|uniref:Uncharacterized protein n=1 Tax=Thermodesulfobium acidiphilum TaxID=1794699 RepID=A0A2R4VZ11_THEAF|nr:hypothetical protein [Thermodesulfobium acidiphilum]AWB09773.1 hypothetical protein TDSAC_0397 [Thermodesulfobium acidiphilum]PMP84924.1 MAG: hypothetical protein C0174_05975 [Thermodesulfobium narugense]
MFDYKIKIENKEGDVLLENNFEILVWYYGPRVMVNKTATIALIWHDDDEEYEKWFLCENQTVILNYISGKSTMRDIVLKSKTSLCYYDFKNNRYIFEKNLTKDDLLRLELPHEESYLGDVYKKKDELLKSIEILSS